MNANATSPAHPTTMPVLNVDPQVIRQFDNSASALSKHHRSFGKSLRAPCPSTLWLAVYTHTSRPIAQGTQSRRIVAETAFWRAADCIFFEALPALEHARQGLSSVVQPLPKVGNFRHTLFRDSAFLLLGSNGRNDYLCCELV